MSAYNGVNGLPMAANGRLQSDILKDEWGFDGIVVSDWRAARETVAAALGGLDIAMPALENPWGAKLVAAVRAGEVAEELIDDKVRRVLRLAGRVGVLDGVPPAVTPFRRRTGRGRGRARGRDPLLRAGPQRARHAAAGGGRR